MRSWINRAVWLISVVASSASASEIPELQFSLKPRLCVLTEGEEACYDELKVTWQAKSSRSLCLYKGGDESPLKCWSNATQGDHRFILSASENVTFQLREPNKKLVVSEAFEVIHDRKKYRRQRRNPWSFF